ncbi:DExH-box ATP-dependent RNA helicase DExH11-like, partial [Bidens hawaiensis]|uniref:DExH-box ATP-dependent RNA helicase DExH11-like n=1 Tax=Bidens hawaiensis TaxID=980011 RepID=UPI004049B783
PPAFAKETPESITKFVEEKYLLPRLDEDEFCAEKSGRQWEFDWFDQAKVDLEPTMPRTVVVPAWELPFRRSSDAKKWEPASVQVDVSELMVEADNSIGVRISGPPKDFVKGSINNRPFRPGGLDDSQSAGRTFPDGASNGEWVQELLVGGPAQVVPPTFKQGMKLGDLCYVVVNLQTRLNKLSHDHIKGDQAMEEYYEWYLEAEMYSNQITEAVLQSSVSQTFLMPGRLVIVKSQSGQDHLLGVILKAPSSVNKQYIVLVLTPSLPSPLQSSDDQQKKSNAGLQILMPKSKRGMDDDYYSSSTARKGSGVVKIKLPHRGTAAGASYEVRETDTKEFLSICNAKIKIDLVGLLEDDSTAAYSKIVLSLLNQKVDGNKYPLALDPVKDLKLKDVSLVEAYYKWNNLLQKMSQSKCHNCIKLEEHIKVAREIKKHKDEVNTLEYQMSDEALQQMPDFQGRIDVLKKLGCIDSDLVVEIKGRVACEMNSGEELICTECLFDNQFDDMEPEEAVALMSAFVFQQRNASEPSLTPRLAKARDRLYDTAIKLGNLQAKFKIQIEPEEYARENLKFGLVEVVYEWAKVSLSLSLPHAHTHTHTNKVFNSNHVS